MHKRWPVEITAVRQDEVEIIKQRYFFGGPIRKGQERNGLSRLWLSALLTADENRADKYELTKIFLSNTNYIFYFFGHTFGSNKNITRGCMDAVNKIQQTSGEAITTHMIKELARRLNLIGGSTILDVYSEEDISNIAYDFLITIK